MIEIVNKMMVTETWSLGWEGLGCVFRSVSFVVICYQVHSLAFVDVDGVSALSIFLVPAACVAVVIVFLGVCLHQKYWRKEMTWQLNREKKKKETQVIQ